MLLSGRPATSPEQDLWCGVMFQALRDASRLKRLQEISQQREASGKSMLYHLERDLVAAKQALKWLTNRSRDLSEVCLLAGIDEDAVLERREKFLAGEFEDVEPLIAFNE